MNLIPKMIKTAAQMKLLAADMDMFADRYGDDEAEVRKHAADLRNAADILNGWADGMEDINGD